MKTLKEELEKVKVEDDFENSYNNENIQISKDGDDDFCLVDVWSEKVSFTYDIETKEIEAATLQTLPSNIEEILNTEIKNYTIEKTL